MLRQAAAVSGFAVGAVCCLGCCVDLVLLCGVGRCCVSCGVGLLGVGSRVTGSGAWFVLLIVEVVRMECMLLSAVLGCDACFVAECCDRR